MEFEKFLEEQAGLEEIEKLVVGGIVRKGDSYLILSRKKDDFMGGIDEIPSGKLEPGESLFDAVVREVKEETNLDVLKIEEYVDYFDYLSGSGKKSRQYNFLVSVKNFENILLTEHDEFKWQNIAQCNANKKITSKTLTTLNIADFNRRQRG